MFLTVFFFEFDLPPLKVKVFEGHNSKLDKQKLYKNSRQYIPLVTINYSPAYFGDKMS